MDKGPPSEVDVLLRCLRDGWIDERQAQQARAEAERWRHAGSQVSMPTLLYALGFLERSRAMTLESAGSVAAPPSQVGSYAILERLGSGGMGEVFRAVDFTGRTVALKLLPKRLQADPESDRRLRREARLTQQLRSPHIVRTFASGKDGSHRWLAMELVPGSTLKQRLQGGGRLGEKQGLVLLAQMASAMRTAAHAGIVHRDIKPANIILASARPGHDEPFCAKLCDFGLAKRWMNADGDPEGSAMGNLTANGMSLGTPHYMSPEQALGQRDLDQRTDIYSLGTVLFHCLTGATVHSGDDSRMIMTEQVGGTIDFTLLADQGVSEPLIGLLKRMLAKSCDQRPADWQALIDDLQRLTPDAVALVPSEVGPGTDRTDLWRTMAVIAWATLIAAVFMTIGGAMWWLLHG